MKTHQRTFLGRMKLMAQKCSRKALLLAFAGCLFLIILTRAFTTEGTSRPAMERSSPETEDLFLHPDLVGKDMHDEAVIKAAQEALIAPSHDVPYHLDNPNRRFFSQHGQDIYLKEVFKDTRGGFFFEVGAFTGETYSNTLLLERELGWTGVLMEPTPSSYRALKSKNRRAHIMRACIAPDTNYSELLLDVGKINANENTLTNAEKTQNSVRVPCYPFYSVMAALGNPVVDYMSLDVEGVEMNVLKSIPWNDVKIRVITIEIIWAAEGPEGIKKFMEGRGFEFIRQLDFDYLFFNKKLSDGLNREFKV
ncbi:uncharacterized protein LOC108669283 isoform X2 [Hyalella azteca]|uniref:Uncharacterized protein LOC108669283 isoform X2 n=1 Tax=Hyalella azteca TaxID=294128 RepID=A0A8B7NEN6_HYAAZ|nr:uncharacterized protein LOC108669283 isoform X2 [Hyalella azteca]